MSDRLGVSKTYKLFIGGKFPRSESGRTIEASGTHLCRASRKDVRDAVTAARAASEGWQAATGYLCGQILYRMAEMLEGKRREFVGVLEEGIEGSRHRGVKGKTKTSNAARRPSADDEVSAAVDRLVHYAGWTDKYPQVLGSQNPVAGPYYNFTTPQAMGVVAAVAPDRPALLGLVSLIAPAICCGNTVVTVAGADGTAGIAASVFGEVCATSDVPGGVVNILTGVRDELLPTIASHRDIDGVLACGVPSDETAQLRAGAAENLKRVTVLGEEPHDRDLFDTAAYETPWLIERLVEFKTIWHPSAK